MKVGQVIGSTDRLGGEASSRPVSFQEVFATLYRNLGVDLDSQRLFDFRGRPQYLVEPAFFQFAGIHRDAHVLSFDDVNNSVSILTLPSFSPDGFLLRFALTAAPGAPEMPGDPVPAPGVAWLVLPALPLVVLAAVPVPLLSLEP